MSENLLQKSSLLRTSCESLFDESLFDDKGCESLFDSKTEHRPNVNSYSSDQPDRTWAILTREECFRIVHNTSQID